MSEVYFLKIKKQSPKILAEAGKKISKVFSNFFDSGDKVAIKLHFGERGSQTYLSPILVRAIYQKLQKKVEKAALVDCNVLYKGERSFASSHKKLARDHGFGFAPILILDGEKGDEEIKIKINKKHFKEIKVGKGIKDFNAILNISHITGHGITGFGGALKNVGMGLGSKGGKLEMHQAFRLEINPDLCQGCGTCQSECPVKAISIKNDKAQIDYQKCIGCGKCISVCPFEAVEIPWGASSAKDLQERIVEYAFGILKQRKTFFLNVLLNITPQCDCVREKQKPMVKDIGILGSQDIVAIDKASLDLVGKNYFEKPGVDPSFQIDYAQKLNLGEKDYKLIEIK
ncbi:DUF362 domain-containing protein [bacterium]|nr:DUF362 domain-containing protein [bacterium]